MLEVNILLKEAGLWRTGVDGGPPQAAIMVVPLFETIADLNAAPVIMAAYFGSPEISALVTERGYQEVRSEEHTSELQSLMRNSYAVIWLTNRRKSNLQTYH